MVVRDDSLMLLDCSKEVALEKQYFQMVACAFRMVLILVESRQKILNAILIGLYNIYSKSYLSPIIHYIPN